MAIETSYKQKLRNAKESNWIFRNQKSAKPSSPGFDFSKLKIYVPPPISCKWDDCEVEFSSLDDLHDHVLQVHIEISFVRQSARIQERRKIEVDRMKCKWERCGAELVRGNFDKKIEWLVKHFQSRHAVGARPFKCGINGCSERAETAVQLENHVKKYHNSPKNSPVATDAQNVDDYQLRWEPFTTAPPRYGHNEWTNLTTLDRMKMMTRNREILNPEKGNTLEIDKSCRPTGSAKRKTGYTLSWYPKYKMVSTVSHQPEKNGNTATFDIENEEKMTFADLFPGPEKAEKQTSEAMDCSESTSETVVEKKKAGRKFDKYFQKLIDRDEGVLTRRKRTKRRLAHAVGGKCSTCEMEFKRTSEKKIKMSLYS